MDQQIVPFISYHEAGPSKALQPYILKYYNVFGCTDPTHPFVEKTLPNGYTSLVFHFQKKIDVSNVNYNGNEIPQSYVFGKYTKLVEVYHAFGTADTFGVIFQPGAFRHLIPADQKQFTDKLYHVCDVLGKSFWPYYHRLEDASFSNWDFDPTSILSVRKNITEEYLKQKLEDSSPPELLDAVLANILHNPIGIHLKSLSKVYGMSPQYLNRLFNQKVGLSVYKYTRIIRFNHLVRSFDSIPDKDLLQLATNFEYHDLSHMVKDFKHFTGDRPSEFLRSSNKLARFLLHQ